jgi:curved DNA-binding protein CbpA
MYKESSFQELLKKLAITLSDSYRIMDLPANTKDENLIKLKYRELVKKYHPDLGGSPKKMVELNQAKERIDLAIKNRDFSTSNTRQEPKRQERQEPKQQDPPQHESSLEKEAVFLRKLVIGKSLEYIKYFEEKTNMKPRFFFKEKISPLNLGFGSFEIDFKFKFEDNAECSLKIRYSERSKMFFYNSDVFYNNRLYSMQSQKYNETKSTTLFTMPYMMFPSLKLTKIFTGKKTKEFKKKDAIARLEKEVFAKNTDSNSWRIPVNAKQDVLVRRVVWMKQPTWMISGLYEKHRKVGDLKAVNNMYFETTEEMEKNFNDFIDFLKKAKKDQIKWDYTSY